VDYELCALNREQPARVDGTRNEWPLTVLKGVAMAKKKAKKAAKSLKRGKNSSTPKTGTRKSAKKNSLVGNINKRKKARKSRSKKNSTISDESYEAMKQGWPKSKREMAAKRSARKKSKESG
jgi:hypothetical protein